MKDIKLIKTINGHNYAYSSSHCSFSLLPDEYVPYWTGEKKGDNSYAARKVTFLKENMFASTQEVSFVTKHSPLTLKKIYSKFEASLD